MITIEKDKKSIIVTVLEETENGNFAGLSSTITTQELINRLIEEGALEDGETVYLEEVQ
ncbi:hypothetical protein [Oceanobacillus neutriphilus]|uniref:Uncharacterized protein n=1 Tax=Oceanobacillus neutriphilus TaxID=531815 RepID=A0ABQ2P417_9BACI|nr:hypothetical protein [Oceanobacillus neutriphilus]GGP17360.1 hypothetical protein GCM10011346_52820 [Oceanobacillus neutriphilus]